MSEPLTALTDADNVWLEVVPDGVTGADVGMSEDEAYDFLTRGSAVTAAAGVESYTTDSEHTGAMVALVPSEADLDRLTRVATEPREELHLTLYFLGEAAAYDEAARTALTDAVTQTLDEVRAAVPANIFGASVWNPTSDEPALVLSVGGDDLSAVRDALGEVIVNCCGALLPDQHTPWVPHVTLAYGRDAASRLTPALGLVGPITFDRVRVVFAGETTDVSLYGSTVVAAGAVTEDGSMEDQHFASDVDESAWNGSAAMAGCDDDPCWRQIAFETTRGEPGQRQHWALPHHKSPGAAPNAAGVRAALGALSGARGADVPLKNEAAARSHLEAHMKQINPDYQPSSAATHVEELATKSPKPSGAGEEMGGRPNPGTKKDKRLKENDYAGVTATPEKDIAELSGTKWQGVLAVEGVETGDGRVFAEGSLVWDMPPLPLRWTPADDGAHQGAVLVARIDNVWRDAENPAVIRGEGVFDDSGMNGAEALRLVRGEFLKGVSVDVDSVKDADVELVFPEPEQAADDGDGGDDGGILLDLFQAPEKVIFHAGRIRAATLVDIPAFVEAQIWLADGTMKMQASTPPPTAGFAELDTLFAHDCGGNVNITACAVGVKALLTDAKLPISLARRRAVYDHLSAHLQDVGLTPLPFDTVNFSDDMVALVAGLVPQDSEAPPATWFTDPLLDEPTPITVTDDGRIYGHGALWNSCHTGFGNTCVSPPREGLHTYFRQGELVTAEGHHVAVGHITLGTGHAPTYGTDVRHALEHYDNTGTVVADVVSGEDQFGIWVSGALRPGLAPARVRELRAAKLSGDWRRIGGQLRLVAFLAVNVPGFPVPRLRAEVHEGRQLSLVASGVMKGNEIAEREAAAERLALNNIREHLQARLGLTPAQRAAALRRRVLGG